MTNIAITFRFKVGDKVEALDRGRWRDATVSRLEAYRGREGYYLLWALPAGAESWISRGGWHQGCTVRAPMDPAAG